MPHMEDDSFRGNMKELFPRWGLMVGNLNNYCSQWAQRMGESICGCNETN